MVRYTKYKKEYNKSEFGSSATSSYSSRVHKSRQQPETKDVVCLQCRKPGHKVSHCPQKSLSNSKRCCYRCGSTEHSLHDCTLPVDTGLPFAKCFVCNTQGHLSGACPENPKGVYPNGGGCKVCGDVRHFVKDCPLKNTQSQYSNEKEEDFFSEEEPEKEKKKPIKIASAVKMVQFK